MVPDIISPTEAASLFCAGVTTYVPLKDHGAGPDKIVGVIGIGDLGHLAIHDSKRDEALKLGATQFVNTRDPEQVKRAKHSIDILLVAGLGKEVSVIGSLTGGRKAVEEMLAFAAAHGVRSWIEKREMSDINAVVKYVMEGGPRYRIVMETEAASKV
ncbi:hypothetical protein BG003_008339 [Podila horticola]|nr:hypothetical protein BG003_008339 [Podila horticola]